MATTPEDPRLLPHEVAQWARGAGLPLDPGRLDLVTATANHIRSVIAVLRDLDLDADLDADLDPDIDPAEAMQAPASAYPVRGAEEGRGDAAV
ncbi:MULTISPECIES: hypothetical protein [Streptomyces]|uniref:hypothetical protein n=1 Tax=Streptomyces TaxID=1883 RepID=UPI001E33AE72|nr:MULTISPECIES: hypothetical protein [Streptomyces]UFQ13776.1 hypothetical protein J2N69_01375 [Streptomyces huasconensis]WCL83371.1 hypothetical protein PPN52_01360 [Streptomyces sp. JCM 35825]